MLGYSVPERLGRVILYCLPKSALSSKRIRLNDCTIPYECISAITTCML